jgi:C-terminal processing protease CtpA/Prc
MQRRHLTSLFVGLALLGIGTAAEAADKGWFGVVVNVDTGPGLLTPTVDAITVERVLPDSPGAKAGIAAGDSIVEIQGMAVSGGSLEALQNALKKSVGETLRLKIRHGGADRVVSMVAVREPTL